jgi:hypothetical protein
MEIQFPHKSQCTLVFTSEFCGSLLWAHPRAAETNMSLICDKSVKIWHFLVTGIERNVCRCTFNRVSVITQFAKLAAGEQLCRRCTQKIIALQNL